MAGTPASRFAGGEAQSPQAAGPAPDLRAEAGFIARRRKRTSFGHRRNTPSPFFPQPLSGSAAAAPPPPPPPVQLMEGLRFLLQKELRNSDVSSLGRIVLPKRETESHLPVLTAREGISLPMQDLETSQLWSFKFRFWPNNKSRMYILESTGEFVRSHDLHLGDFIMLYKDDEKDRYVIRARKAGCQEQLLVDPMPVIEDGIFDSIIPDIVVARARYSDLYLPLAEGMNMALGMNCAFSADFSMSFLPDDGLGSSSSCMESLSLDDFY